MLDRPVFLEPNVMRRPYRGGERLAAFRGFRILTGERLPEDWLASTTAVYGSHDQGLTRLADGRLLRDAIRTDPVGVLGPDHVAVFGPDPALLVKLLDAQQRLSIHLHPDRPFARARLGSRYGKTEAWHVLSADPGAVVHIAFRESIDEAELIEIVEGGCGATLLDRMHRLPVESGDTVFVPAGVPHAIGEGIFLIEAQEPTDLLVRLEWSGYAVEGMVNDLGLGFADALNAVDRSAWSKVRLDRLVRRRETDSSLLPDDARGFFRMTRYSGPTEVELDRGYKVLVVSRGAGTLRAAGRDYDLKIGSCIMVPWGSGPVLVRGDLNLICCEPARPSDAMDFDADLASFPADLSGIYAHEGGHDTHQCCC